MIPTISVGCCLLSAPQSERLLLLLLLLTRVKSKPNTPNKALPPHAPLPPCFAPCTRTYILVYTYSLFFIGTERTHPAYRGGGGGGGVRASFCIRSVVSWYGTTADLRTGCVVPDKKKCYTNSRACSEQIIAGRPCSRKFQTATTSPRKSGAGSALLCSAPFGSQWQPLKASRGFDDT